APAEELFVERGCGRLTMNMVLVGPEFAIARADTVLGDFCIPSLEVAGPGGHWVEVSRAVGMPGAEEQRMLEAYTEYFAAARSRACRCGSTRTKLPFSCVFFVRGVRVQGEEEAVGRRRGGRPRRPRGRRRSGGVHDRPHSRGHPRPRDPRRRRRRRRPERGGG